MDDLDVIRSFRHTQPQPSSHAKASARAALEERMNQRSLQRTPWWSWKSRRTLPVLIVAAMLAVALLSIANPPFHAGNRSNAAVRELNAVALVAAAQPPVPAPAEHQYMYTRSDGVGLATGMGSDGHTNAAWTSGTREFWIAPDGSGRIRQVAGEPIFLGTPDEAFEKALSGMSSDWTFESGSDGIPDSMAVHGFTPDELNQLANNPAALAEAIRSRADSSEGQTSVEYESFATVGDLLRESAAPPELRAALFQVAAGIQGIELVGPVEDHAGRPGIAVAMEQGGIRHELIFDPRTSVLLEEQRVLVKLVQGIEVPLGTVISYVTYRKSGIVNSISETS